MNLPAPLPRWPRPTEAAPHRRQTDAELALPDAVSPIAARAASKLLGLVAEEFPVLLPRLDRNRFLWLAAGTVDEAIAEALAESRLETARATALNAAMDGLDAALLTTRRKVFAWVVAGVVVLAAAAAVLWMQR